MPSSLLTRRATTAAAKAAKASKSTHTQTRRALGIFAPHKLERGYNEFGPGGRSSVAGFNTSLFGGTGFLGKYLQFELGKVGTRLWLANRGDEQDVRQYKVAFDLGQWASVPYSIRDEDSIKRVLEGSDVAINCIGMLCVCLCVCLCGFYV